MLLGPVGLSACSVYKERGQGGSLLSCFLLSSVVIRVVAADVSWCRLHAPAGQLPEKGALVPRRGGCLGQSYR